MFAFRPTTTRYRLLPIVLKSGLFCWLFPALLLGQPADTLAAPPTHSLLESLVRDEIPQAKLVTDFRKLIREKNKEERLKGTFSYQHGSGEPISWDIQVRTRGNQRKKVCYFPPLKLYFPKSELKARGFDKTYNDYKVVVSCKSVDRYGAFVLKEYLLYKLYGLLTDHSFRVQLLQLRIEDRQGKQKPLETYGFIIENQDELAARISGQLIETRMLSPKIIAPESYDLMALFQFMIGNTDWYAYINHNLKVFKAEGYDRPIVVPYDFDYSGAVNADYATPNGNYPMKSIRERYFLGPCKAEEEYAGILDEFRQKKEAILSTVEDFPYLEAGEKKELLNYLSEFFEIIENPKLTRQLILDHCDKHVKMANR